ncbi:MAG: type II secretion system protein N [Proteobacteria bacterium]|nr:type II secretion system protein N [Pseudomonadota bacterium]
MIGRLIALRDARAPMGAKAGLIVLFVVALVALLPLWVVAGRVEGLSAQAAQGSVWAGRLQDAAYGPLALGDLDARLAPLPLLLGRAEVALRGEGFAARLSRAGVREASGMLPLRGGLGALPVESAAFDHVTAVFRDGACDAALGRVGLTLAIPGVSSLVLSGEARCAGAVLLLPLRGPGGMERLDLRVQGDGRWRADLVLSGLSPEAAAPLRAAGLAARPDGLVLRTGGRF